MQTIEYINALERTVDRLNAENELVRALLADAENEIRQHKQTIRTLFRYGAQQGLN